MKTHEIRARRFCDSERNSAVFRPAPEIIADPESGGITRRHFAGLLAATAFLPSMSRTSFAADPDSALQSRIPVKKTYPLFEDAVANVLPVNGFQSQIELKDSIVDLVRHGVIQPEKFNSLYASGEPLPSEFSNVLSKPSDHKIVLTSNNARYYVNLLWPVGLATHMDANAKSPMQGKSLFNFASTGGWNLGRAANGGTYFNKFPIVQLTKIQEALVVQIAKATFRPCCGNSTFFQDCNHGSALLGLLQLGASQGLNEKDLYKEALAFNSFWFPDYYVATALYFKIIQKTEWRDVNPAAAMGSEFSSGGPWRENVLAKLTTISDLFPPPQGGANCGT